MAEDTVNATRRTRKPKARKFYQIGPDFRLGGPPGLKLANEDALKEGRFLLSMQEPGFPEFPDTPRFVFDKKLGRPPRDIEQYETYWFISDRMKEAIEAVDAEAFAFVPCDVRFADNTVGPTYWLCDVMRVLDALDEPASRLKILDDCGHKLYSLAGGATLIFKEDVVGSAHIFRMAHLKAEIFCDQQLKDACNAANLKGVKFRDAAQL